MGPVRTLIRGSITPFAPTAKHADADIKLSVTSPPVHGVVHVLVHVVGDVPGLESANAKNHGMLLPDQDNIITSHGQSSSKSGNPKTSS